MEIVILIVVFLWFFRTAKTAGRRSVLWGIAGGVIYFATLILTKSALYVVLVPPRDYIFAFGIMDLVLSNAAALGVANFACRRLLKENLVTLQRFVHATNIGWLVIASVILVSPLLAVISGEFGAVLYLLGLGALAAVPLGTLRVHRAKSKSLVLSAWQLHVAFGANLLVGVALIWYITTLRLSHPVAFSISTAYYVSWFAIAACLNALSVGLTLNSRRTR